MRLFLGIRLSARRSRCRSFPRNGSSRMPYGIHPGAPDGLGGQGHQFSYIKIRILELLLELGVQSLVHLLLNLYVADRIEAFIADNREEE